MLQTIKNGMVPHVDSQLVDELMDAYIEAKRNYYLGGLRLSAVEGGRFCEAAFRILQQRTTGTFDALGVQLRTDALIASLANVPGAAELDSVRLHIPRALRVVYDIRNKRDNAHLADGIDPNIQDATLVVSVLDWVVAEFIRLYHQVDAAQATDMVASVVTRAVPAVEDFQGFLKVLKPNLPASETVLVLLYQRGQKGATYDEMKQWVHPKMVSNLRRTLRMIQHDKAFAHGDGQWFWITQLGQRTVESKRLLEL